MNDADCMMMMMMMNMMIRMLCPFWFVCMGGPPTDSYDICGLALVVIENSTIISKNGQVW